VQTPQQERAAVEMELIRPPHGVDAYLVWPETGRVIACLISELWRGEGSWGVTDGMERTKAGIVNEGDVDCGVQRAGWCPPGGLLKVSYH
jgi:hypothetical protein